MADGGGMGAGGYGSWGVLAPGAYGCMECVVAEGMGVQEVWAPGEGGMGAGLRKGSRV